MGCRGCRGEEADQGGHEFITGPSRGLWTLQELLGVAGGLAAWRPPLRAQGELGFFSSEPYTRGEAVSEVQSPGRRRQGCLDATRATSSPAGPAFTCFAKSAGRPWLQTAVLDSGADRLS